MLVLDGPVHAVLACDPGKARLAQVGFVHMKVNKNWSRLILHQRSQVVFWRIPKSLVLTGRFVIRFLFPQCCGTFFGYRMTA